jgi:hypothetical protein
MTGPSRVPIRFRAVSSCPGLWTRTPTLQPALGRLVSWRWIFVALDKGAARANLNAWAKAGITLVRDVGSPGGMTFELTPGPGIPVLQAAGRFLAPEGRYFRTC